MPGSHHTAAASLEPEATSEAWSWNGDMAELIQRLKQPAAEGQYAAIERLLKPLLLSPDQCARLQLNLALVLQAEQSTVLQRFFPSAASQPLQRVSLLAVALRCVVQRCDSPKQEKLMLQHLHVNIEANGFDLDADSTAILELVGCFDGAAGADLPHCGPQLLALCASLLSQPSFKPSMLQLPIESRWRDRTALRLLLSQAARCHESVAEAERVLSLLQQRCATVVWQLDQTGETPMSEIMRLPSVSVSPCKRQPAQSFSGSASQDGFGRLPAIVVSNMRTPVIPVSLTEPIAWSQDQSGRQS